MIIHECKNDTDGRTVFQWEGMTTWYLGVEGSTDEVKIKYCPYCGEELK